MDRAITVRYSPEMIKSVVWKYWIRAVGVKVFIVFSALVAAFMIDFLFGDRSWLVGVLGAAVFGCGSLLVSTYFVCLQRSMNKFEQMGEDTAHFRFTDEYIGVESGIGKSEIAWKLIEDVWKYPSFWLIFIAEQSYFTLPIDGIDEQLKEFINSKVAASGGKHD